MVNFFVAGNRDVLNNIFSYLDDSNIARLRGVNNNLKKLVDESPNFNKAKQQEISQVFQAYKTKKNKFEELKKEQGFIDLSNQKGIELKQLESTLFGKFVSKLINSTGLLAKIGQILARIFPCIRSEKERQLKLKDERKELEKEQDKIKNQIFQRQQECLVAKDLFIAKRAALRSKS